MIERKLSGKIRNLITKFPAIGIIGPRESGKTTLVKNIFPDFRYVSLEDFDTRTFAQEDPHGFLSQYNNKVILDEVQKVPELFSYLQTHIDKTGKPGQYILTGSQNFLLHEKISQTLAGRIALLKLMPLSIEELKSTNYSYRKAEDYIYQGFYPRIYKEKIEPPDWYPAYIQTYIEKDVRQIKNITDLGLFQKFIKLCAGRIGQVLNLSSLANDCGITHNTAKSWISLLESSFIIFLLKPHHKNFNKRIIKIPKLYFYDTGIACSLLGIEKKEQIANHYLQGSLFENFILAEFYKNQFNQGREENFYFWRDQTGHEIDCIIEHADKLTAIEIKSGKTIIGEYFQNLNYWNKISQNNPKKSFIIYGGEKNQERKNGNVISWTKMSQVLSS